MLLRVSVVTPDISVQCLMNEEIWTKQICLTACVVCFSLISCFDKIFWDFPQSQNSGVNLPPIPLILHHR